MAHGRWPLTVRGCETRGVRGSSDRRGSGLARRRVKFLNGHMTLFGEENTEFRLESGRFPREVGAESVIVVVPFWY